MHRHLVVLFAAMLAAPAPGSAQTSTADRERIERARERAQEKAQQERERLQEARDRAQERRDRERERDRERDARRHERESAGSLDTVVAFDARGLVSVTCPGGAVIITGGSANEIRVRARTENGGIRFTSTGGRATLEPVAGRGCSDGRFEVTVPAGARVAANSWSGSVIVRGVHGDVEAHTQSADVEVRDAGGRLEVESLSGDVSVQGVGGESSIHTVSGDVELTNARGDVEIETVSGDLELRDVAARQIRTHTTSGDVNYSGRIVDAGRYEFNTHSGEIRLRLPSDVGAQLSVSTYSGGIDSDFPITLRPGASAARGKRLDFALGQGTARIIAETFSGDIILTSSARRR